MSGLLAIAGEPLPDSALLWNETFAGRTRSSHSKTCLPDSLELLGYGIDVEEDGPFSILAAVNCFVDTDLVVQHVPEPQDGDNLLHFRDHFSAIEVSDDAVMWKCGQYTVRCVWHALQSAKHREITNYWHCGAKPC